MKREIKLCDKVYLYPCKTYEQKGITALLNELLDKLCNDNGFQEFEGKTVVLKPNLLAKRNPDAGVTTKPSFVKAAASYFKEKGARVIIADSPGGVYHSTILKSVYKECGMVEAIDAELNLDVSHEKVKWGEREFPIITPLVNADIIVNLARMKTHTLCDMTAAVKNLYGSVPGLMKAEYHAKYPDKKEFSELLIDLCLANAPQINIIDGIIGMEGEGPANGTPVKSGVVIGSANPFAADLLCAELMGYEASEVDTVRISRERGLCPDSSELCIEGADKKDYIKNYKRPKGSRNAVGLLRMLPGFVKRFFDKKVPYPFIVTDKCVGCGECARCCPMSTISIADKKAHIEYNKCIKCFCCQELCPKKAVIVKKFKEKKD